MRINTFATPSSIADPNTTIRGRFAVVIDTLRATTVIAAALAAGAARVLPVAEVEDALKVYKGYGAGEALLCGERGGNPIPGFHLGNSPLEYTPEVVRGKTLVMTTTNGTRAILAAVGAARLALGAMANASAVAAAAVASGLDVTIVCAGTKGFFTLEDILTAGAIVDAMGVTDADMDDLTRLSLDLYRRNALDCAGALVSCAHARVLAGLGYAGDVAYCMKKDMLNVVPYCQNGEIRLLPEPALPTRP
jgi:2-phosphosulfolactate phosphatase